MQIEGPDRIRHLKADDFFKDLFETVLESLEILTAISVPKAEPDERQIFEEVARRSGDHALAGLCLVRRQAGHRTLMLSVGEMPELALGAMAILDARDFDGAVTALRAEIEPPSDTKASTQYWRHIAGVLLRRAVGKLTGGAP